MSPPLSLLALRALGEPGWHGTYDDVAWFGLPMLVGILAGWAREPTRLSRQEPRAGVETAEHPPFSLGTEQRRHVEEPGIASEVDSRAPVRQTWEATAADGQETKAAVQRQALLFDVLLDAVLIVRPDWQVVDCNPAAEQLFGCPKREMVGRPAVLFRHPSVEESLRDAILAELQQGGRWSGEIPLVCRGGERVSETLVAVHEEPGGGAALVVICRDISGHKEAEEALAKSQQQLLQAQKMEAIGRLSGAIAHDFNNMLTAIKGFSSLLQMEIAEHDPRYGYVEEIQKAADHSASLTRQLLAFSRQQVLQPRVIGLNEVVLRMEGMLGRLIGENITLQTALDPGLPQVFADPGQFEQVLMNLAVNARDAMPDGGKLTIQTSSAILHEEHKRRYPYIQPGSYVMLAVQDSGSGMPEEIREQIFEPFFTTKAQGQGTGLGLSTVYGIVKQSGGYILVDSQVGVGTTFRIYLPRRSSDASAGEGVAGMGRGRAPEGSETILLVEDEAVVRKLASHILRRSGYLVLEAGSGTDALHTMAEHTGPIHLLLTDVVMPGMSGKSLAEEVLSRGHQAGVLFMSGYTDDAIAHHGVLAPGTFFIEKPFTPEILATKVREVIDASRARSASTAGRDRYAAERC